MASSMEKGVGYLENSSLIFAPMILHAKAFCSLQSEANEGREYLKWLKITITNPTRIGPVFMQLYYFYILLEIIASGRCVNIIEIGHDTCALPKVLWYPIVPKNIFKPRTRCLTKHDSP